MGLLSNPVIAGLLSGGPNAVRAREQQRLAAMLPRGQGGMMGAPSGVVRQDSGLGQGIAGLGEGLATIGEMRAQQQAQEQAKTALERALGMSSGPDAIKQNVAAGGQAGPTVAAASRLQQTNPMGLSSGVMKAARMAYDAGDYSRGFQLVQDGLTASGGEAYTLSPGEVRYGPDNRPLASVPGAQSEVKPPPYRAIKRNGEEVAQEWNPNTGEWTDIATNPIRQTPLVEIKPNPMETAEASARGTSLAARGAAMFEVGQAAASQIPQLEMALSIADTNETGQELPSQLQFRAGQIVKGLGFDVESPTWSKVLGNVSSGQAFNALMQNAVLGKMQAQKGPQTESDMRLMRETVAGLGNTPEARNFLLRSALSLARRDVQKSAFYEDFYAENGTYDGAEREWTKEMGRVPLFGRNPTTGLPVFFPEFMEKVKATYPDMTESEIRNQWIKRYGRR